MTLHVRIGPTILRPCRIVDHWRAEHERDRALFAGARRQREIRELQAARRDDDDGDAA
jgi:hypothetical protein